MTLSPKPKRHLKYLTFILSAVFSLLLGSSPDVYAHGGTPRVLKVIPAREETEPLWVIDTLGAFRANRTGEGERLFHDWAWLCDDAVDPTLGVDDLSILSDQTMIAVAKSGLYRSQDGGCHFVRVDSPINQFALGQLSSKPSNPTQIAIYTDSIGQDNSVWWSEDAGLTWIPSDLTIDGSIYSLWRDPKREDELWVNHARGLSFSDDGGRSFRTIDVRGYGMEASATEARLLGGGELGDQVALFVAINRFPTASLMLSLDRGESWTVVLELDDSFESLLLTPDALWVSSPFEGLSRYRLSDEERINSNQAWRSEWLRDRETFVACLREDPLIPGRIWGCGRSAPSSWIVGYTDHSNPSEITWQIVMRDYSEASEGQWGCAEDSPSVLACESRCLEANCDPSGREVTPTSSDTSGAQQSTEEERNVDEAVRQSEGQEGSTHQGCAQLTEHTQGFKLSSIMYALSLICLMLFLVRSRAKSEGDH